LRSGYDKAAFILGKEFLASVPVTEEKCTIRLKAKRIGTSKTGGNISV
jgi:hypothetical protein